MSRHVPARLRIPVPFKLSRSVGLGDVVKKATTAIGIKPCGGCQRRAAALNRAVTFEPRTGPKRSR